MNFFDSDSGLDVSTLTHYDGTLPWVLIAVGIFITALFLVVFFYKKSPRSVQGFSGLFALAAFIGLIVIPAAGLFTGPGDAEKANAHVIQEWANTELNVTLSDEAAAQLARGEVVLEQDSNAFSLIPGSTDPDHLYMVYLGSAIPNKIYQVNPNNSTGNGDGSTTDPTPTPEATTPAE